MKMFLLFLVLMSGLYAAAGDDINALIDDIVNAPAETRYEKMNAFKQKMRELNARQRTEALQALQAKVYPNLNPAAESGSIQTVQVQSRTDKSGSAAQQMRIQQQQYQMQQNGTSTARGLRPPRTPPPQSHQGGR